MERKTNLLNNLRAFIEHGLPELISGFRNPVDEAVLHHQCVYDISTDSLREHHYGIDEFPYEYCTIRYFSAELHRRLNDIKTEIQAYIGEARKSKRIKEPGRKKIFTELLAGLQETQAKSGNEDTIRKYEEALNNFFASLYGLIADDVDKSVPLSFKYQYRDDYILMKLYHMDIKGISFIDRAETGWAEFRAILMSKNVYAENAAYKIQLQCKTRVAAYILRKMEDHFKDFSYSNVVASERFYSERATLIKGSNLNVSLTRDGKPIPHKEQIDQFFASL